MAEEEYSTLRVARHWPFSEFAIACMCQLKSAQVGLVCPGCSLTNQLFECVSTYFMDFCQ